MLEGKLSSRKACHKMLGGLLIKLKTVNLTMGVRESLNGVCNDEHQHGGQVACPQALSVRLLGKRRLLGQEH